MSTIWSPSTGAEVDQTLAKLHYCLGPDQRDDESEGYSGFLCGAWDLRLLLLAVLLKLPVRIQLLLIMQ